MAALILLLAAALAGAPEAEEAAAGAGAAGEVDGAGAGAAPEVHVSIDLQGHPAMHIPWWMFGKGLTDRPLARRTWRHMFRQQVSEPTLRESGVRIFLAAAMAAERAKNPKQARRLIDEQLDYIEAFVAAHPEDYALATSPAEVRELVATTDKLVFVHSIEGGHHLLWEEEDVAHWAERGVALITLIHLRDKELGGAAILDQALGPVINRAGAKKRRRGEDRGLTPLGEARLLDLWRAGIVVDFSHLSPDSVEDGLRLAAEHGVRPVFTHGKLDAAKADEFAISEAQLVEVYRLGGLFATGLSAEEIGVEAPPEVDADVCWGTLEAFAWHHQLLQQTVRTHAEAILGEPVGEHLSEAQRTRLAIGWSSDWNGWLSHSRPVVGRHGCREGGEELLDVDVKGVAHPGVLPDHWRRVEQWGTDTDPLWRSAERFLQIWEEARGER